MGSNALRKSSRAGTWSIIQEWLGQKRGSVRARWMLTLYNYIKGKYHGTMSSSFNVSLSVPENEVQHHDVFVRKISGLFVPTPLPSYPCAH